MFASVRCSSPSVDNKMPARLYFGGCGKLITKFEMQYFTVEVTDGIKPPTDG